MNSYHKQWGVGRENREQERKGWEEGVLGVGVGGIRREMQNAKFCHLKYFQKQEPKISCDLHLAFCQTKPCKSHASCYTNNITFLVLVF